MSMGPGSLPFMREFHIPLRDLLFEALAGILAWNGLMLLLRQAVLFEGDPSRLKRSKSVVIPTDQNPFAQGCERGHKPQQHKLEYPSAYKQQFWLPVK